MRKIQNEAFKAGSAGTVMPKIIAIINKRAKTDYMLSPMSGNWKDKRGSWSAYDAYSATSEEVLRFKFALGKSDVIKEVEYLESYKDKKSKYIIDLEGMFIVKVVEYIVDVLTGEFEKYSEGKLAASRSRKDKPLSEAVKMSDSVRNWITDENIADALSRMSDNRDFENQLEVYNQYASGRQFKSCNSINTFKYHIKTHLKQMGVRNDVPAVTVSAGGPSTQIIDTSDQTTFEDEVIENEHLLKYVLMETSIDRIRDGDPNLPGVYIYGTGGIGKSFYAEQELGPLSNAVFFQGGMQGYTALLNILYPNRHGKIIILDDMLNAAQLKPGTTIENIFKGALGSKQHVDVVRPGNQEATLRVRNGQIINEEEYFDVDSLADFAGDDAIMDDKYNFDFTSKLVFITNLPVVPEAFADRLEPCNMILTKDQIVDVIRTKLDVIVTDVDTDDKYFYFEWLRTNLRFAKKVSFRQYDTGLRMYLALRHRSDWENIMRVRLKSGIAAKY